MLSIAPPPTIYLHSGATDMRKSFDGRERPPPPCGSAERIKAARG